MLQVTIRRVRLFVSNFVAVFSRLIGNVLFPMEPNTQQRCSSRLSVCRATSDYQIRTFTLEYCILGTYYIADRRQLQAGGKKAGKMVIFALAESQFMLIT